MGTSDIYQVRGLVEQEERCGGVRRRSVLYFKRRDVAWGSTIMQWLITRWRLALGMS